MKLVKFRTITKDKRAGSVLPATYWHKAGSVVRQLNVDGWGEGSGTCSAAGNRRGSTNLKDMLVNDSRIKDYEINSNS